MSSSAAPLTELVASATPEQLWQSQSALARSARLLVEVAHQISRAAKFLSSTEKEEPILCLYTQVSAATVLATRLSNRLQDAYRERKQP